MASLVAGVMAASLAISLALTWTVRQLARSRGWMAGPVSRRHVHSVPIPRLGGVAVFIATTVLVAIVSKRVSDNTFFLAALLPSAWMFTIGLVDDIIGVSAVPKLAAQLVGGITLFCVGLRIPVEGGFSPWLATLISFALTVGWAVLVMNAINLVDGLDGLASGSSVLSLAAMLVMSMFWGDRSTVLLIAIVVGALLGFLCFNWHPASIFLGDSGSLLIGTLVAAISIRLMQWHTFAVLGCAFSLAHPLGEVGVSIIRRFLRAHPVFRPDRRHLHHRLLDRGLAHRRTVSVMLLSSGFFSLAGVLTSLGKMAALVSCFAASLFLLFALGQLRYAEFSELFRWVRSFLHYRTVIDNHLRLQELQESLPKTQSMTELRNKVTGTFLTMGFADVRLQVSAYDQYFVPNRAMRPNVLGSVRYILRTSSSKSTLELFWDAARPVPVDLTVVARKFVPLLTKCVVRQGGHYRENPRPILPIPIHTEGFITSIAADATAESRVPLPF